MFLRSSSHQDLPVAVILTALEVEYMAVRAHLSHLTEEIHSNGTIYERGIFRVNRQMSWQIAIVEIGAGSASAALEAERAIKHFDPSVVFFVGVAGGIKDVKLGDVVAADKIWYYEYGRAEDEFRSRADGGRLSYRLIRRATVERRKKDWLKRIKGKCPNNKPKVFLGPIAAGEKVVASKKSEVWKRLHNHFGDVLAVEMEAYGFLRAIDANPDVDALVIRGISDQIDKKNESDAKGWQEIASRHASAFAFEVLAKWIPSLPQDSSKHRLREDQPQRKKTDIEDNQTHFDRLVPFQINKPTSLPDPKPEKQIDDRHFARLRELLEAKNWQEADLETSNIIVKLAKKEESGLLNSRDIEEFSASALQVIDDFWMRSSNDYFGFGIQRQIWQDVNRTFAFNPTHFRQFCDKIDWYRNGKLLETYDQFNFTCNAPKGHLPSLRLPALEGQSQTKLQRHWKIIFEDFVLQPARNMISF